MQTLFKIYCLSGARFHKLLGSDFQARVQMSINVDFQIYIHVHIFMVYTGLESTNVSTHKMYLNN